MRPPHPLFLHLIFSLLEATRTMHGLALNARTLRRGGLEFQAPQVWASYFLSAEELKPTGRGRSSQDRPSYTE
jgi:hypothetical protein